MSRAFYLKFFLALIVGLAVIFVFDRLDVSALSVPLCLAVVLMGISLRQNPSLVVAVSLIYSLLVTYSAWYLLYHSSHPQLPFPYPAFALVQRVGLFVVVCAMAIYMSAHRATSERTLADVKNTLSKLPVPVVISNEQNLIIYANESLYEFLGNTADLTGKRYTDFFMPYYPEGKALRTYFELFEFGDKNLHEVDFTPLGSSVQMRARLSCIGTGSKRILVTVLQPLDSPLSRSLAINSP